RRLHSCVTLFPYTTLFRSLRDLRDLDGEVDRGGQQRDAQHPCDDERQGFEPSLLRLRMAGILNEFLRHRPPAYGQNPTGRWTHCLAGPTSATLPGERGDRCDAR